jgi:hypothetical protein
VLASTNNADWTDLGTFPGLVFGRNTLTIGSPGSYRYYLLRGLAGPNANWVVQEVAFQPDPFAKTIYVTPTGAGRRDGTSWANAFGSLQGAIDAVSREGDQIWVAQGTYRPTAYVDSNVTSDPRSRSFVLKGGVQIYGGFAGSETAVNQRNVVANPTILSGDFNSNDSATWPPDASRNDNAYHVVVALNQSKPITLDGLTITAGNANNSTYTQPNNGSPIPSGVKPHEVGGGGIVLDTEVSITNCLVFMNSSVERAGGFIFYNQLISTRGSRMADSVFRSNASGDGGAISFGVSSTISASASPFTLVRCVFEQNRGKVFPDGDGDGYLDKGLGGAILVSDNAQVSISNCAFINNLVDPNNLVGPKAGDPFFNLPSGHGGAIQVARGGLAKISTSMFAGNEAMWAGGAINIDKRTTSNAGRAEIYFSTFFNNKSRWGGGINNHLGQFSGFGNILYQNWSLNGSGYVSDINNSTALNGIQSNSSLSHTLTTSGAIYNNTGTIVEGNPRFADPARPAGADGIWFTADDGLKISSGSAALNIVNPLRRASLFDFADVDGDGNTTELLPVDGEGVTYSASATFYHAGAYQTLAGTIAPQPPGIPGAPVATADNAQVLLSWMAASDIGGSAISDYLIQVSANGGLNWTDFNDGTSTATSATVTGLDNGTGYVFRVAARNAQGPGFYSPASVSVTPSGPPPAPSTLIPTVSSGQVSIAFNQVSNGGSPISNYEFSTNNGSVWIARSPASTNSPIVLNGLANGTPYQIRLRALNPAGAGTASAALTITPASNPGAPTGLAATVNSTARTAALNWSAPADNGGSAITDYQVQFSVNGTSWTTFNDGTSASTSATITNLPTSAGYSFRVAAVNAAGTGVFGPAVNLRSYPFPSAGGAFASSTTTGYPVTNAFDGATGSPATVWHSQGLGFPHEMGYDFGSAKTVNSIVVEQGWPGSTGNHATSIQVLASTNNADWTDLGTFPGLVFGRNTLTIGSPGSYRYYLLRGLAGPNANWVVQEVAFQPDPFAKTIYVTPTGAGRRDGSSWENAYADLEQAMRASIRWNDEIIMGTGTYRLNGKNIKVDGTR